MNPKGWHVLLVTLTVLSAGLISACGDDDGFACGEGTIVLDGQCVAPCPDGQVWLDGECVDIPECSNGTFYDPDTGQCIAVCAEGTTYNEETGQCEPTGNCDDGTVLDPDTGLCVVLCDTGETWNGSECVQICAEGTTLNPDTGECEVDPDICPPGTHWEGGECVPDLDCGPGTHPDENGQCVPDVLPDPDVPEDESLVPGPEFSLPETGPENAVSLGGTISAPEEAADFDAFVFRTASGGEYLKLWATSEGACLPAFSVMGVEEDSFASGPDHWAVFYNRVGLNPNGLEASREIFLPMPGVYVIGISDYNNFANELFGFDYLPVGGDDFSYYMTVERLADPVFNPIDLSNPAPQTGSFDQGLGFFTLTNLPGADEVVQVSSAGLPDPLGSDVVPALMLFDPNGAFMKEIPAPNTSADADLLFLSGSSGEYRLVQDYLMSIGPYRDYQTDALLRSHTEMDSESPPVDMDLPAGEEHLLSWDLTAGQIGIFAAYTPNNSKELEVVFYDHDLDVLTSSSTFEDFTATLWPAYGFLFAEQDMRGFIEITEASGQAVSYQLDFLVSDTPALTEGDNSSIPTIQMPSDSYFDAGIANFTGAAGDLVLFSGLTIHDPPKAWVNPQTLLKTGDDREIGPIWDIGSASVYSDEVIGYLPNDGAYLHWVLDDGLGADILGGSYDVNMATQTPSHLGSVSTSQDQYAYSVALDGDSGLAALTFLPDDVQLVEVVILPAGGATIQPEIWLLHFGELQCGEFSCLWTAMPEGQRLGLGVRAQAAAQGHGVNVSYALPYAGMTVILVKDAGSAGGAGDTFDVAVVALESPCLNPEAIVLDGSGHAEISGDNSGGENLITEIPNCTDWLTDGPEAYYSLDLTAGDQVSITLDTASIEYIDFSLYVIADCFDPNGSCVAGSDTTSLPEVVNFTAPTTGPYIVVVDGFSSADHAPFDLTVDVY